VGVEVSPGPTSRADLLQAIVTIVLEMQRQDLGLSKEYAKLIGENP